MFQSLRYKKIKKNTIKNKFKKYMKRNYSLRMKMTLTLTVLTCLTIFIIWLFNQLFLEEYYISSKLDILDKTYQIVNRSYSEADIELSEKELHEFQRLSETNNVRIYVITDNLRLEYPKVDKEGQEYNSIFSILQDYFFRGINKDLTAIELEVLDSYSIYKLHDKRMDASYLELVGRLDNNYIVYARTNLESIQENVLISNQFLGLVGLGVAVLGAIFMFYFSNRFTKQILVLSEIAKKMTDLDFTVKYKVVTQDEIGTLGSSINTLSEKLEETISELKSVNNELRLDIKNKIKINERQQEFVSNVSHELKTPIAIIQGYVEGLKENVYEDESSRDFYCDVIIDETKKMNNMVKGLISLSQLESGDSQIEFEHFDIVMVISSIINTNSLLFNQKNINCIFNHRDPLYVWGDIYMVEEVLNNYISNAINHAQGSKIIEINLEQKDEVVRVSVFNTGDNIPQDELDKVWDKFYKVDKARTREYGGSGIGLSIVKAIMTSLNQNFGVINYEDGVEFWFELDTKAS